MQKTLPATNVEIVIKGNTFKVPFPTTGQFIDIQSLKARIAVDNYSSLSRSEDFSSSYAKLLVDCIATFNTLIPNFQKTLNVQSILDLSMLESREIIDQYVDVYLPFHTEWMNLVSAPKAKPEDGKKDELDTNKTNV